MVLLLLLIGEAREVCRFLILLVASCRRAGGCRPTVGGTGRGCEVVEGVVVVGVRVDVGGVGGVTRARASLPRQFEGCAGEELRVGWLGGVGLCCWARTVDAKNGLAGGGVVLLREAGGREGVGAGGGEEALAAITIETGCAAAAVAGERADSTGGNGAGNESWWDRISLAGRGNQGIQVQVPAPGNV